MYPVYSYYYYTYYNYDYWYTGLPYFYGGESESFGAFITDSWTISPRLTLDIGVRVDNHKGWIEDLPRLDADSNETGEIIAGVLLGATVLAGELSLLAAFTSGELASAHQRLGRGEVRTAT